MSWARRVGSQPITYPECIQTIVDLSCRHHLHNPLNRHHRESDADKNDMTVWDIVEAVCDMTAISCKMGYTSCNEWIKNVNFLAPFSAEKRSIFEETIAELYRRLVAAGLEDPTSTFYY